MIYIHDKKRRYLFYIINLFGLSFYPIHFIARKKWQNKKSKLKIKIQKNKIETIVLNINTRIGDVLMTTPVIKAVKNKFPNSKIIIATDEIGKEILQSNPYIDAIIIVRTPWIGKQKISANDILDMIKSRHLDEIRKLKHLNPDLLIDTVGNLSNILLVDLFFKPRFFIGHTFTGFGWFFDLESPYIPNIHRVDNKLKILEILDVHNPDKKMELFPSAKNKGYAKNFYEINKLDLNYPIAIFHLGANWEKRAWPLNKFLLLAKQMEEHYNFKIVITGGKKDRKKNLQFQEKHKNVVVADDLSIQQTAAIMEVADVFVGNDSGPMHLARAAGLPVVAIFGPDSPKECGVENDGIMIKKEFRCQPCGQIKCDKQPNCVEIISVNEVFEAVKKIFNQYEGKKRN